MHNGSKVPLNARVVPLEILAFVFLHSHMVCTMKHHVLSVQVLAGCTLDCLEEALPEQCCWQQIYF